MAKESFNIQSIYDFFHGLLYGEEKLTSNLYFDRLPDGIEREVNEMSLVDISDSVQDLGGCGKATISVYNYIVPDSEANIDEMDKKLFSLIENYKSDHYLITRDKMYPDYDYERGMECHVTLINLLIV